jgi:hypothetical protein
MEEGRSGFKVLKGKQIGKRLLGRPRHKWEESIRINLKKIGVNMGNLTDMAQDRDYWRALVNMV